MIQYGELDTDNSFREAYAILYSLGCKDKLEVKNKLRHLSAFFGNIGSVSDITPNQIVLIVTMLNLVKSSGYQFHNKK